jgi:transketolase
MGNDDITIFDGVAQLKIIDVSCPQQLLAIMKWIMNGNRGLLYVRVMRAPSGVIYGPDYAFEFGKGHVLKESANDKAVIISTSRGVHEALVASAKAAEQGLEIGVVDMPSIDEDLLLSVYHSGKLLCFAEQNNGYLLQNFLKILYRRKVPCDWDRVMAVNALDANGRPQYIHSGTYEELIEAFKLTPAHLAGAIGDRLRKH